jgi:hypothetical protein
VIDSGLEVAYNRLGPGTDPTKRRKSMAKKKKAMKKGKKLAKTKTLFSWGASNPTSK